MQRKTQGIPVLSSSDICKAFWPTLLKYAFLQDRALLLQKPDQCEPGYSLRCPFTARLYFSPGSCCAAVLPAAQEAALPACSERGQDTPGPPGPGYDLCRPSLLEGDAGVTHMANMGSSGSPSLISRNMLSWVRGGLCEGETEVERSRGCEGDEQRHRPQRRRPPRPRASRLAPTRATAGSATPRRPRPRPPAAVLPAPGPGPGPGPFPFPCLPARR